MDEIAPPTLRGRVGEHFRIVEDARVVDVRLREIEERGSETAGALLAVFTAERPHGLEQGLYTVENDELAATELFLVPSSTTDLCATFTWLAPHAGTSSASG